MAHIQKKRPSTLKKLLRAFREGHVTQNACKIAGISPMQLWRWRKDWPNLNKRIEQLKESRTELVVDSLFQNCIKGNVTAQKFYLVNKGWKGDKEVDVKVFQQTEMNVPVASQEESERVKAYAELIQRHNLVSRVLGPDGHQFDAGGELQGQQREEDSTGGDTQGNP